MINHQREQILPWVLLVFTRRKDTSDVDRAPCITVLGFLFVKCWNWLSILSWDRFWCEKTRVLPDQEEQETIPHYAVKFVAIVQCYKIEVDTFKLKSSSPISCWVTVWNIHICERIWEKGPLWSKSEFEILIPSESIKNQLSFDACFIIIAAWIHFLCMFI